MNISGGRTLRHREIHQRTGRLVMISKYDYRTDGKNEVSE